MRYTNEQYALNSHKDVGVFSVMSAVQTEQISVTHLHDITHDDTVN